MNPRIQRLRFSTYFIYLIVFLLGSMLSALVYFDMEEIESHFIGLIDEKIPTLSHIQSFKAHLSEQERELYEYYATTEEKYYQKFQLLAEKSDQLILLMHKEDEAGIETQNIFMYQNKIKDISQLFHMNMASSDTNWDKAREQLMVMSEQRRMMLPLLTKMESKIASQVRSAYDLTKKELNSTGVTVLIFSISIILIALFIGRYINSYLRISAKNERLVLFTQRNPNPIISITERQGVIFSNPAAKKLLHTLKLDADQIKSLIPANFGQIKQTLFNSKEPWIRIDRALEDRILEYEVHWLKDMHTYDLHIMDITERKIAEEQLNYQATHNPTTGLLNLYKLQQVIIQRLASASEQEFTLGLIEMREFNRLIRSYGIEIATEARKTLATHLRACIEQKKSAQIYQVNDQTFALIIPGNLSLTDIQTLVSSLLETLKTSALTACHTYISQLDFGFCHAPGHGTTVQDLMHSAGIALEDSIENAGAHWQVFSDELGQKVHQRLEIEQAIRDAIDHQEFELYYQPQLDIQNKKIIGVETLIRWHHEDRWISPVEFIPIAEQTGLIVPLGEWILKQACIQAKTWQASGFPALIVAVNISPVQFRHPEFIEMVTRTIEDVGIDSAMIELEITEGVALYNEQETIHILEQLRGLGLKLSIDDFGTGYSSLSYLQQFPIDKLKIDQSFIRDMTECKENQAIVQTVIDLAQNLHLKVIAEGVETQQHQDFLLNNGCDEIQGYLFSRPLSHQQATQFIEQYMSGP
ncbi:putative bifunctional diguanylate cyclase/phosphodiesterase [Algicola sagamiensis]|uniref:putative bifunctional diguanylate cyclase/phosphodiesterase n=1 Tax=Algicola sagamiensis TaxID=163869 RepID=UPI000361C3EE|nr:GGDEF domain-containing phosphodiesterase [Algicola sagamiensis]